MPDSPWSRPPLVIAWDYGGTLAPHSVRGSGGTRIEQPVLPAAAEMIRRLRDVHGIKAILSSNNLPSEPRRPQLQAAGLSDYFDAVLLSTDLSCGKPNPLFYEKVLSAAWQVTGGCQPPDILHIGDSRMTDVTGPIQHGMRAMWLTLDVNAAIDNQHLIAAAAVRVITSITDVPQALGLES
jgi:FMN phosphatase YigB (HAD superfamily)